jgi:hypothetical protein
LFFSILSFLFFLNIIKYVSFLLKSNFLDINLIEIVICV